MKNTGRTQFKRWLESRGIKISFAAKKMGDEITGRKGDHLL